MATIQVRNIPEDVHRVYRARAAAAGMSLQEYLRAELVRQARRRTPAEVVADVEAELGDGGGGFTGVSSADLIGTDRSSH
jgi:plasmid stability protein